MAIPIAVNESIPDLLPLASLASGLGCLYVLEGSTLGGRIIARRARAALGDELPVTFFTSANRLDPGAEWRTFQAALDAWWSSADEHAGGEVVAAANQTFRALQARLDSAA